MRVTVCELPHEAAALDDAWRALCEHAAAHRPQLLLLPELSMVDPVWEAERFDAARWAAAEATAEERLLRLPELRTEHVVGTRPVREGGRRLNQAYVWSADGGARPLRSKHFLPEEAGWWEATWFDRGDPEFPVFRAAGASFGVNVCSELWALETYAAYAERGAELVLSPRATSPESAAAWLAAGVVAAVRSGAFGLSSNRAGAGGQYGGRGWIVDPSGEVLATTSAAEPFATREIDLAEAARAKASYPRYVFAPAVSAATLTED